MTHGEDIPSTCHTKGGITWTARYKNFQEQRTIEYPLDPDNHEDPENNLRLLGVVEATEDADGYTGDTYCLACGKKVSTGSRIPALGGNTGNGDNGDNGDNGGSGSNIIKGAFLKLNFSGTLPLKRKQKFSGVRVSLAKGDKIKTVRSANNAVVAASFSGTVITLKAGKKTGSTTVKVTLASGLTRTFKVKVQKKAVKTTKVTAAVKSRTLAVGESFNLSVVINPISSKQKVKYKSSNKKVVSVTKKGIIKGKKKGKAVITITSGSKKTKVKVTVR